MSAFRRIDEKDAEQIVLSYLQDAKAGALANWVDSQMLMTGSECMALRDVEEALERCVSAGDAENLSGSGQRNFRLYKITEKGRERLKGGTS